MASWVIFIDIRVHLNIQTSNNYFIISLTAFINLFVYTFFEIETNASRICFGEQFCGRPKTS